VLFAAALVTVAIAAAPALALSTTLRGIVGLGSTPREVPAPEFASLADKLRIGMTKSQVRSRIGTPSRVLGACWQYDEHLTVREDTLDAERVYFLDGVYLYRYSKVDGCWDYPGQRGIWPIPRAGISRLRHATPR
jgi:hypothetical protein